jgi:hypothetical protein
MAGGHQRGIKLWRRRGESAAVGAAAGQNALDYDDALVGVADEWHAPVTDPRRPLGRLAREKLDVAGSRLRA